MRTATAVTKQGKAPVAQLDRASDYGSEGLGFESLRACSFNKKDAGTFEQVRPFLTLNFVWFPHNDMGASRFRLNIRGAGCMWRLIGWPP